MSMMRNFRNLSRARCTEKGETMRRVKLGHSNITIYTLFFIRTFNEPVNERQILPVFSAAETGVKHISDSQQNLHLSNKIRKEWKAGKSGICLRRYALRLTFSWKMI